MVKKSDFIEIQNSIALTLNNISYEQYEEAKKNIKLAIEKLLAIRKSVAGDKEDTATLFDVDLVGITLGKAFTLLKKKPDSLMIKTHLEEAIETLKKIQRRL